MEPFTVAPGPAGTVTILFDLNGMLIQSRGNEHRQKVKLAPFEARPGLKYILSLLPMFRVGLYTSSSENTVRKRIQSLVSLLRSQSTQGHNADTPEGTMQSAFPCSIHVHHPAFQLFQVILPRDYCILDETRHNRIDGKPWDTVKPLACHGFDLTRTILLDDSARKILPHETFNAVIVPPFLACSDPEFLEEAEEEIERWDTSIACRKHGSECMGCMNCSRMPAMKALCLLLCHHVFPNPACTSSEAHCSPNEPNIERVCETAYKQGELEVDDTSTTAMTLKSAPVQVDEGPQSSTETAEISLDIKIAQEKFFAMRGINSDQTASDRCHAESNGNAGFEEHVKVSLKGKREERSEPVHGTSRVSGNCANAKECRCDVSGATVHTGRGERNFAAAGAAMWHPRDVRGKVQAIREDLHTFLYTAWVPQCLSQLRGKQTSRTTEDYLGVNDRSSHQKFAAACSIPCDNLQPCDDETEHTRVGPVDRSQGQLLAQL